MGYRDYELGVDLKVLLGHGLGFLKVYREKMKMCSLTAFVGTGTWSTAKWCGASDFAGSGVEFLQRMV